MTPDEVKCLSKLRLEHANECLESSKKLFELEDYKSSANRSYYAIFHAMRAILAYEGFDSKRHSGIISKFLQLYIKTNKFDKKFSDIITDSFEIRADSDYDDYYTVSIKVIEKQIENAELFLNAVTDFLNNK